MNFNHHPFWPKNAFYFKSPSVPSASSIPAPPAPAASESSLEVTQAKMDARRQAKNKQGIASTILAGAGGADAKQAASSAATPLGGKTTLLGGG